MTKEDVAKLFMLLKAAYPSFVPERAEEAEIKINLWVQMFSRNTYTECEWAAQRCIETCIYPPTVADMKQWLGMNLTRDDKIARLPFDYTKPVYANEAYMEAKFEELMRTLTVPKESMIWLGVMAIGVLMIAVGCLIWSI